MHAVYYYWHKIIIVIYHIYIWILMHQIISWVSTYNCIYYGASIILPINHSLTKVNKQSRDTYTQSRAMTCTSLETRNPHIMDNASQVFPRMTNYLSTLAVVRDTDNILVEVKAITPPVTPLSTTGQQRGCTNEHIRPHQLFSLIQQTPVICLAKINTSQTRQGATTGAPSVR